MKDATAPGDVSPATGAPATKSGGDLLAEAQAMIERQNAEVKDLRLRNEKLSRTLHDVIVSGSDLMLHQIDSLRKTVLSTLDAFEAQVHATRAPTLMKNAATSSPGKPTSGDEARDSHKEFEARESVLGCQDSSALVRVAVIAIVSVVAVDVFREADLRGLHRLVEMYIWGFQDLSIALSVVTLLLFTQLWVVPLFTLRRTGYLSRATHLAAYVALQAVVWAQAGYAISTYRLRPPCACMVMCEVARHSMKMHAFTVETGRFAREAPGTERYKRLRVSLLDDPLGLLRQYVYFSFAPTLVYRNVYPRTARTHWGRVLAYAAYFCAGITLTGYIFCQTLPQEPGWRSWSALLHSIMSSMIPGLALFCMAFFGVLHTWMNAFAEILQFADREFYQRWWTARSYASYYRRWNKVVGDWIHAYLYSDFRGVCGYSKLSAMLLSFLISAAVHEYLVAMTLGFVYPVMFILFAGFGVFFMFLNNAYKRNSDGWNWFLWSTLFFGNGVLLTLYSAEFLARKDSVVDQYRIDTSSWVPYSWQIFARHQAGQVP